MSFSFDVFVPNYTVFQQQGPLGLFDAALPTPHHGRPKRNLAQGACEYCISNTRSKASCNSRSARDQPSTEFLCKI
jgi:hypothetical protein